MCEVPSAGRSMRVRVGALVLRRVLGASGAGEQVGAVAAAYQLDGAKSAPAPARKIVLILVRISASTNHTPVVSSPLTKETDSGRQGTPRLCVHLPD